VRELRSLKAAARPRFRLLKVRNRCESAVRACATRSYGRRRSSLARTVVEDVGHYGGALVICWALVISVRRPGSGIATLTADAAKGMTLSSAVAAGG
jgi:hypothetical protein